MSLSASTVGGIEFVRTGDGKPRGVLLWNVWERVEWARELVREGRAMSAGERADLVASLA